MRASRKDHAPDQSVTASVVGSENTRHSPNREIIVAAIVLAIFMVLAICSAIFNPSVTPPSGTDKTAEQLMAESLSEYGVVANGKYSAQDIVDLCSPVHEFHGKYSTDKPAPEKVSITATMNGESQTAVTVVCDPKQNTRIIAAYKTP